MGAIEAGRAYLKYYLEDKDLKRGLKQIGTQLQNVGKIGVAATAPFVAGFAASVTAALKFGDAVGDMAARTGIAVESLSALKFAAEQSDASAETLEKAIQRLTINVGNAANGTGTFAQTLNALGVDLGELVALTPDQQFLKMADALAAVENPAQRAALAQKAFGKASAELLPLLSEGKSGIEALMQTASDFGVVLTTEDVTAIGELDKALKGSTAQVIGLGIQIGVAVSGPLTKFLKWTQNITVWLIDLVKEHQTLTAVIGIAAAGVAVLCTGLIALGVACHGYTLAASGATAATVALTTAFTWLSAHPIIAVLTAIAAAVLAVGAYFKFATGKAEEFGGALDDVAKSEGLPTGPTKDLAAINAQAAKLQTQIEARIAAGTAAPAVVAPTGADFRVLESMDRGIRALVEIQKHALDILRRNRDGGLVVGPA